MMAQICKCGVRSGVGELGRLRKTTQGKERSPNYLLKEVMLPFVDLQAGGPG